MAVISCNSMRYADGQAVGIPSAITFTVAYAVQAKFATKLAAFQTVPTVADLQSMLISSADEAAEGSGRRSEVRCRVCRGRRGGDRDLAGGPLKGFLSLCADGYEGDPLTSATPRHTHPST